MHEHNVAHRDLKCENVLLDAFDNVKIGDFGFARVMDTPSQTYCGSRAYAPPEILQVKNKYTNITSKVQTFRFVRIWIW